VVQAGPAVHTGIAVQNILALQVSIRVLKASTASLMSTIARTSMAAGVGIHIAGIVGTVGNSDATARLIT
jgi:hypothetical protein